ncbi:MAG: MBOAT family protein, partial [Oscillospiraceae bacterium]|nr:MBOAT family protein [Oscillospiraceae bacterium]
MNFNSPEFLIFLPVTVLVYWLLPHKARWVWLLAASWFFYMYWKPVLIILILITTLVSYGSALMMERRPDLKKPLLILTLVVCLGILGWFKYAGFFADSALGVYNLITGKSVSLTMDILLPVGISFYTFQTLSYVIDVYRGDFPAEHHFGYYALFVAFFPQLVAGPIENPRNLLPQLRSEHKPSWTDFRAGMRLLAVGFFRKCCVADVLGVYVNNVYNSPESANGLAVLAAGGLFCLQIYNDFAGYSQIAAGAARLMGVRL